MPEILGSIALGQVSHNVFGTSDTAILPDILPPALRPASRRRNKAIHEQHRDDVRGEQVDIEVSGDHGRAAAPTLVLSTPLVLSRWPRMGG
jgi:hypothetical protein